MLYFGQNLGDWRGDLNGRKDVRTLQTLFLSEQLSPLG